MAPIKFEEQLKEKLEKRSISPSSDSWTQLADRLDAEDQKSNRSLFWWLSIAASIIVLIAVSVTFFTNNTIIETPQVVIEDNTTKDNDTPKTTEDLTPKTEVKQNEQIVENKVEDTKPTINPKKESLKSPVVNKTQLAINTNDNQSLDDTKNDETNTIESFDNKALIDKTEITQVISDIKKAREASIDKEVDSLLQLAQKELFKYKLQKETKVVDANQLLNEVEEDMGQSFRSKVFEALKDSYKTVKTAVAERNN